jgi:hypothetical protein
MPGEDVVGEADRALAPPGPPLADMPQWACTECGYATPGTIDAPYVGDGTCPDHPERPLRILVSTPVPPVPAVPPATSAPPASS